MLRWIFLLIFVVVAVFFYVMDYPKLKDIYCDTLTNFWKVTIVKWIKLTFKFTYKFENFLHTSMLT